jgi:hypothetical protein
MPDARKRQWSVTTEKSKSMRCANGSWQSRAP